MVDLGQQNMIGTGDVASAPAPDTKELALVLHQHTTAPPRTAETFEPRPPLARRTYDNIYSLYAHDPECRCCHPNDRPYCPCPCHTDVSRGEARLREVQLRRDEIPSEPRLSQRPAERRPDPRLTGMPGKAAG